MGECLLCGCLLVRLFLHDLRQWWLVFFPLHIIRHKARIPVAHVAAVIPYVRGAQLGLDTVWRLGLNGG